tara:strand:+ start:2356 stop:2853 length:498 start_codon:yes stop_codon:yes gene_type:complete
MKLVIHTQYRENYGAHDWDGKGECPQYWKFKGGSTYVVPNILGESPDIMKKLRPLIEYGNYGSEEYILDYEIVENNAKVCESWESVTQIFINQKTGDVVALKVIDNREDGWMRSEILEKTESWTMMPESERKGYSATYLMRDGDICDGESELKNWFDTCGQVEAI